MKVKNKLRQQFTADGDVFGSRQVCELAFSMRLLKHSLCATFRKHDGSIFGFRESMSVATRSFIPRLQILPKQPRKNEGQPH